MKGVQLDKNFIVIEKIGKGAFSNVYKTKRLEDGKLYALKRVSLKKLKEKELQNTLNEIRILASVKHPNIIGYRDAFIDSASNDLCIIMDYAGGGDLASKIKECKEKKVRMPENIVIKFFYQLTSALYELHMRKIIHRDLKTANVFMTKDLKNTKLGDMNVSKVVKNMFAYTQTGTPYYASPEVWRDEPYNIKADIWSLGCVIYEICMLKPPFNSTDMDGLFEKVQKCRYEPFDNFYSKELQNAIGKMLTFNPHLRPSTEKILNFSVFNDLRLILGVNNNRMDQKDSVFDKNDLLDTIQCFKDFSKLNTQLPKPQYSKEKEIKHSMVSKKSKFPKLKTKGFKKKKKCEQVGEVNDRRFSVNSKKSSQQNLAKSKRIQHINMKEKILLDYKTNRKSIEQNKSSVSRKKIPKNNRELKSVGRRSSNHIKVRGKSRHAQGRSPQLLINNSSKSNKESIANNKKIILKHMARIKKELSKNSDTINRMLLYQQKKLKSNYTKKKSIVQLPTIKSMVKNEIVSNNPSQNLNSELSSLLNIKKSKSIKIGKSMRPYFNNKNSQILQILKKNFGYKQPKRAQSAAYDKANKIKLSNRPRIKSSKVVKNINKKKIKQFLIQNSMKQNKNNKNVFINFSVNQNLCVNMPKRKTNKFNIGNFIDYVNKNKSAANHELNSNNKAKKSMF